MVDQTIIKEWLAKGEEDFKFAEANLKDGSDFYAQICFHFQQAAEKFLKAYIIANGLTFNKVHDLVNLLNICSKYDLTLADLKEDCIILNASYIETRYPVHWPTHYTKESAQIAYNAVTRIANVIQKRLS